MIQINYPFDATLNWFKQAGNIGPGSWGNNGMLGVVQTNGIYAIYQNQLVNYVGRANNLASRLKDHLHEAYNCCDNDTVNQLKCYYAVYQGHFLAELEAILIRTASVTNPHLRNQQSATDIQMGYGVVVQVNNAGKVPNFIKTPGVGALVNGYTQPFVFNNGVQVKPNP